MTDLPANGAPTPPEDQAPAAAASPGGARTIDRKLLEILVCPLTKDPLRYDVERQELVSERAGLAYPIRDGIPIMLVDEARRIDESAPS